MNAPEPSPLMKKGRKRGPRKQKPHPSMSKVGEKASPEAKKRAAAVLEVLGGARSTSDAAAALGYTLPRYYQLEARAISGLVAACEPVKPGRVVSPLREVEALRKRCARLEREVGRHQALVRAAHRTVGLAVTSQKPQSGKKRAKRPTARALVAARVLTSPPQQTSESLSGDSLPST